MKEPEQSSSTSVDPKGPSVFTGLRFGSKAILGLCTVLAAFIGYNTWSASRSSMTVYLAGQTTIADLRGIEDSVKLDIIDSSPEDDSTRKLDVLTVQIYNDGGKAITEDQVFQPVRVQAADPETRFLSLGQINSNPTGIDFDVSIIDNGTIEIQFGLLNPKDILQVPIIGSFADAESFSATARIESVRSLKVIDARSADRSSNRVKSIGQWALAIGVACITWIGFKLPAAKYVQYQDLRSEGELSSICLDAIQCDLSNGKDVHSTTSSAATMVREIFSRNGRELQKWRRERLRLIDRMDSGSLSPLGVLEEYDSFLNTERKQLKLGTTFVYAIIASGWVYIAYLIYI